ncbi:MAG TPA: hypothetical protein VF282_01160 [Bacillota bacterium]
MRPVDMGGNLSQINEVARLHQAGDLIDEQGRRAQADDARRAAQRQREQVGRAPESQHARVERDGRGSGGGGGSRRRPGRDPGSGSGDDPPTRGASPRGPDDGDGRGRLLDVRV